MTSELPVTIHDIEAQRPHRRRTLLEKASIQLRQGIRIDSASILPRSSSFASTWTSWSREKGASPGWSAETLTERSLIDEKQNSFLEAITGILDESNARLLERYRAWYVQYLAWHIEKSWVQLFRPVLGECIKDDKNGKPCEEELSKAFGLLEAIVSELHHSRVAIITIVDELYNKDVITDLNMNSGDDGRHRYGSEDDVDRFEAIRLVFASIGWISAMYAPSTSSPSRNYLEIERPHTSGNKKHTHSLRRALKQREKSDTVILSEKIEDIKDQAIFGLLKRFGDVIPRHRSPRTQSTPLGTPNFFATHPDDYINVDLICFNTLHKVAGIKIQLVDCLSRHLEFDPRKLVLHVFQFPSLCLIHAVKSKSVFSKIFEDSAGNDHIINPDADARAYFREVVLTYRLIFGQTYGSYTAFNKIEPSLKSREAREGVGEQPDDPLFRILCGQPWEGDEAGQIYDVIDAEYPPTRYNPNDFPFLASRLLKLQNHVREHKPHNLMAFWNDRRNLIVWWGFWPLMITTLTMLVLQIVQTVLQFLQVLMSNSCSAQNSSS